MHKLWDWVYESTFWGPTFRSCHNTEVSVSRSPQTCQLRTSWSHNSFIFWAQIMKTHFMLGRQKETSPKATGKNQNTKGKNPTLHLTTYSTPSTVKPYFTHQKTRSNLFGPKFQKHLHYLLQAGAHNLADNHENNFPPDRWFILSAFSPTRNPCASKLFRKGKSLQLVEHSPLNSPRDDWT